MASGRGRRRDLEAERYRLLAAAGTVDPAMVVGRRGWGDTVSAAGDSLRGPRRSLLAQGSLGCAADSPGLEGHNPGPAEEIRVEGDMARPMAADIPRPGRDAVAPVAVGLHRVDLDMPWSSDPLPERADTGTMRWQGRIGLRVRLYAWVVSGMTILEGYLPVPTESKAEPNAR